jgi:F0F1-type ATP synthase membrane subunit c/vacuolar-type H+-ATPase subunit K
MLDLPAPIGPIRNRLGEGFIASSYTETVARGWGFQNQSQTAVLSFVVIPDAA